MSEKRFQQSDPNVAISEYIKLIWDSKNCYHMSQKEIIDFLNGFYEKNEQLKEDNEKWERFANMEFIKGSTEIGRLNKNIVDLKKENERLKERLYEFEKQKIIEESKINEDVIPKIKLLRTELFGEKYE